jgi:hypothetical protein
MHIQTGMYVDLMSERKNRVHPAGNKSVPVVLLDIQSIRFAVK